MKPFLRNLGRGTLAAIVFALSFGTVFSATTGTSRTQQALLELFCDACGQPQNVNIRDLAASTVTLLDAQTITGAKTFSGGITAASIGPSVTGTPYVAAAWSVPFFKGPTGTMANNGAVTWGTALPRSYSQGAWVFMPAGAIATSTPAAGAWLWYVGTNTTTGTFFNSTYSSGTPTLGTATAYVTTGPGAFTGDTTERVGPSITIPASALGLYGEAQIVLDAENNNTGGTKTVQVRANGIAGTVHLKSAQTTITNTRMHGTIGNWGSASVQMTTGDLLSTGTSLQVANGTFMVADTINTGATWTLDFTLSNGTATDYMIVNRASIIVLYRNS